MNFGLAKVTTAGSDLTRTQSLLGTSEYMAPEQAGGRTRDTGTASDFWALGMMLYQLLFSCGASKTIVYQLTTRNVITD